jgi:uncharacterized protein
MWLLTNISQPNEREGTRKMAKRASLIVCAVGLGLAFAHTASAVEALDWQDLAPPWDETQNPLTQLSNEQQDDVYAIFYGPNYGDPSGKKNVDEQKAYDDLAASGVDPAALFAKIEKLSKEADTHDRTLVSELDGRVIKLPGYVLPIEFEGTLVRSFLLVPYVGACIHVPPPPPNQIVHVHLKQGFENKELFAPVWVTGRISAGMDKASLTLVDGSTDVNFGYALQATKVEPYEE